MSFIKELKQRCVFRVGIAYAVVAWLLLQVADVVLDNIEAPAWVFQAILLLLIIGLPVALVLAWAFELTPEGIKKERDVDRSESSTLVTGRKLDFFIIAALSLVLVFVVIDQYVLEQPAPTTTISENLRSIAVLPFTNRSAEEENAAFFADGVHDELLTRLSKIGDLRVISRTSVMEYRDTTKNMRQIAAELGVGSILEGGVQRAGDTVRINVQLIDAQTDEHLWADTYDRDLTATNLFAIQTEISTEIANALQATLSPDERKRIAAVPTENIEALEAYFIAQQMIDLRDLEPILNGMGYFERAVELDPSFALAYSGLAGAWLSLPNFSAATEPKQAQARAAAAAAVQKAVDLDPDSPDTLAVLGWHQLRHEYNWQGAEQFFRRALQIEPSNTNALHFYSHLLSWQGQHSEAIELAKRAVAADPLSTLLGMHLSGTYSDARQWNEAISLGEEILRRDKYSTLMTVVWRGQLWARRSEDAAAMFSSWAAATGRDAGLARKLNDKFILYQQAGDPVEVPDELVERLQLSQSDLAQVYASVGDSERTIGALQRLHLSRTGPATLMSMNINPSFDFIRDDPRFVELLEQIGLAD